MTNPVPIPPHVAAHVLFVAGEPGGYAPGSPGSFLHGLVETWFKADAFNRERLRLGFPAYGAAIDLYMKDVYGVAALRAIARGEKRS